MTQPASTRFHASPALCPGNPPKERWLAIGAAALLLGLYALFLGSHGGAYAGGADSSGYMNNAKLLRQGSVRMTERVIAGVDNASLQEDTYVPLGFRPLGGETMTPGYPIGIPLIVVLVSRFTGWEAAPAATAILFSLLGILVTAWLAREFGLPTGWAWFAAVLIAIAPTYINMSLQLMSDVPSMVFCATAIASAWKSRTRPVWAVAAGAAFAAAVLVRPNDMLILIPAAICLGSMWRRWIFFGLGGLPGAVFLCTFNHIAYGRAFEPSYGNVSYLFTVKVIPATLLNYAHWLPFVLTPVGLLALGLPCLHRRDPVRVNVLLSWIFVVLGFYAIDRDTHQDMWILRYLLPAFPAFLVGGVLVLKAIMRMQSVGNFFERMSGALPRVVPGILIWAPAIAYCAYAACKYRHGHDYVIHYALPASSIVVAIGLTAKMLREKDRGALLLHVVVSQLIMAMAVATLSRSARLGVWAVRQEQSAYPNACAWAAENLPANSVIYAMQTSGALLYYTPFTLVRWDQVTPQSQVEIERACAASGRPIYALLFPFEVDRLQQNHFLDRWTRIAATPPVTCWRLDLPGKAATTP